MNVEKAGTQLGKYKEVMALIVLIGAVVALIQKIPTSEDIDQSILKAKDAVLSNTDDPRFPWNQEKGVINSRINRNETDIAGLVTTSRAQAQSVQSLKASTENLKESVSKLYQKHEEP